MKNLDKVCILGCGFVGLTLGVMLSSKNIKVIGIDSNFELVEQLKEGKTSIYEPGMETLLGKSLAEGNLKFINTDNELSEVKDCGVFIITVGTPLKGLAVDLNHIVNALSTVLEYISDDSLVILRSTTMVGTANSTVRNYLNQKSAKIKLAMCPERTVEGNALTELLTLPQIIGADDEESFQAAESFFKSVEIEVVRVSSLKAAELCKLANNTFRDLMFAFANEIALLAANNNVSAREIIQAANYKYARSNIALPGPSGGPCLEKDPWILVESGKSVGVDMPITRAAREINESIVIEFLKSSCANISNPMKVAILGLSFKGYPLTLDSRGSFAPEVISFLDENFPKTQVFGFEPAGIFRTGYENIQQCTNLEEAIIDSDLVVILTNAEAFLGIEESISKLANTECLIIDYWGILNRASLKTERYRSWV